jgi:hypothetical protein
MVSVAWEQSPALKVALNADADTLPLHRVKMADEQDATGRRKRDPALQLGARKKP